MIAKGLLCFYLLGCALAQNYGDDQDTGEQHLSHNYYNPNQYENARAEPYDFGFQSTDEFGTIMNRQESSDNNGAVRGSYGYTDPHGVFRHVDYIADEYGFRAEVKSNEPGMGTQSPANVQIYAEPPPAGVIVERSYYNPHQHLHPGQSGQASGQQPSRRNPSASGSSNNNRQVRPSGSGSGSRVATSTSATRTVYPYVQNQQNSNSYNTLSSSQYPATVSNQYAANAAAASASASSSGNQYATSGSDYSSGSATYQASGSSYPASVSTYPARNPYGSQGYSTLTSSQYGSSAGSSSSSSAQQPIVAKPYDGPTYKIGNPHVTEYKRADKQQSGTYLLPTVIATGNAPTTLVKHIHTYPAQA